MLNLKWQMKISRYSFWLGLKMKDKTKLIINLFIFIKKKCNQSILGFGVS